MPSLLFIDDEPESLEWALSILRSSLSDATIDIAETVEDSIEKLNQTHYDLVVMDIFIPMGDQCQTNIGA